MAFVQLLYFFLLHRLNQEKKTSLETFTRNSLNYTWYRVVIKSVNISFQSVIYDFKPDFMRKIYNYMPPLCMFLCTGFVELLHPE